MLSVVVYDISDNSSRSYLIKRLQHYGPHRLQKSVFIGHLDSESILELSDEFINFISSDNDSIILFPFCKNCMKNIFIEGNATIPLEKERYRFL